MSYMPSQPYVTMLAVYPPLNQNGDGTYIRLVDNFQLRSANGIPQLEDEFMIILNESNIWSSGYLLVDVDGLAQLFMMSDGKADLSFEVNDEIIIDQISRLTELSSSTLVIQTLVLQHICNTFTLVNSIPELKLIKDIFPDHISSNIDPEILLQDWQQFINSRNGSFCVFPQEESILLNYQ